MNSDKSFYDLASILLAAKEPINISKLAKMIFKSRRIVYYNIEKMDIEFEKKKVSKVINESKKGILLNIQQKKILGKILSELEYVVDKNERKLIITLLITTYPKRQTLNDFIEIFKTSKNSILSDIALIKQEAFKFNNKLKIISETKKGYVLKGPELVQIQYIYRTIKEIISLKNYNLNMFIGNIYKDIDMVFSDDFMELLVDKMEILQVKLGKTMSVKEINNFVFACPYLYIFSTKTKSKSIEKSLHTLQDRLEYKIVCEIIKDFEKVYNTKIENKIKLLFTLILLCTRKITDLHNFSKDYINQTKIAKNLIEKFENETAYKILDKESSVNELVTYFKVQYFRNRYNIISVYKNYEEIGGEYKEIYEALKKLLKKENLDLNEYDYANLSLYFSLFIKTNKRRIMIVSDEGSLIKKNIEKKILENIANIEIVKKIDKNSFYKYKNNDIDLVISTELDLITNFEVIFIDSFLTKEELTRIFIKLNNLK